VDVTEPEYETPPAPEGYKMIGQRGEQIGIVLARIYECWECGAGVTSTKRHDAWHRRVGWRP
jgi:hypothetical protein